MNTATITPPRIMRQPAPPLRRTGSAASRQAAVKPAEDPYQGFSKQDYEYLCEAAALYKAGKLKVFEREIPEHLLCE